MYVCLYVSLLTILISIKGYITCNWVQATNRKLYNTRRQNYKQKGTEITHGPYRRKTGGHT